MRARVGDGHILISGTGRAGTTLLVRYFTALGFDTGFAVDERTDKISNAGLEWSFSTRMPHVVKSPSHTETLGTQLAAGAFEVAHCIVPMRRLHDAAESRRRVYREASQAGLNPISHPGSIWMTGDPMNQEAALALQLYKLIDALAAHRVPTHLLHFPEFVEAPGAAYGALRPILDEYGISEIESECALQSVCDLSLIHKFE